MIDTEPQFHQQLPKCSVHISQITVSNVLGGTGAYTCSSRQVQLRQDGNNPVLSADTNLTNLSWMCEDANGCIAMQNVTVVSDAHQPL
jgi:hypothetical protein